jgi:hypothetical protein
MIRITLGERQSGNRNKPLRIQKKIGGKAKRRNVGLLKIPITVIELIQKTL